MARRRKRGVWVALAILAAAVVAIAVQVEDWGRDFTTNVAKTSPDHPDERLRPIVSPLSDEQLAGVLRDAARRLRSFEFVGESADGATRRMLFVRTSTVFRFKDDVIVRVEDRGSVRAVSAESRSRVGKGDLGQNPRNLRNLLGEARRLLREER